MLFSGRVIVISIDRGLECLAHVLKLADGHIHGNVEHVDGEALESAERVVKT